jgi:hypothetical protein
VPSLMKRQMFKTNEHVTLPSGGKLRRVIFNRYIVISIVTSAEMPVILQPGAVALLHHLAHHDQ